MAATTTTSPDTTPTAPAAPVAVVTGASAGVGRATVRAFADRGYDVALLARGAAGLEAAAAEVRSSGRCALPISVDVADARAVDRAAERVEQALGPIGVWVNVAMTTVFAPLEQITADEFERATRVTYLGQVHGTMSALRRMRPRDRGVVVSVGSALAFQSIALQAPYCGAKFACRGFHDSVRAELRHAGSAIRVAQVHLPAVNTPQFGWCRNKMGRHSMPVPPIYQPEVAAKVIVDVARRPRRQRIVGVWNRGLVQLSKVFPGPIDHFVAATTVDGQQTDEEVDADAPDNLNRPLDGRDGRDRGAHGVFDERAGGMLDRRFLASLPRTALDAVRALGARACEVGADWLAPGGSGGGAAHR